MLPPKRNPPSLIRAHRPPELLAHLDALDQDLRGRYAARRKVSPTRRPRKPAIFKPAPKADTPPTLTRKEQKYREKGERKEQERRDRRERERREFEARAAFLSPEITVPDALLKLFLKLARRLARAQVRRDIMGDDATAYRALNYDEYFLEAFDGMVEKVPEYRTSELARPFFSRVGYSKIIDALRGLDAAPLGIAALPSDTPTRHNPPHAALTQEKSNDKSARDGTPWLPDRGVWITDFEAFEQKPDDTDLASGDSEQQQRCDWGWHSMQDVEDLLDVMDFFKSLPLRQRRVANALLYGFSLVEIARWLGVTTKTVGRDCAQIGSLARRRDIRLLPGRLL